MTKARSNATANAAKGDLTVGNGTNLSGVLGVGANGETIVADASTATGLRYTAGTVQANPIINSSLQVWQRGTSFTNGNGTNIYGPDRWHIYSTTTGRTWSRQATNDTTNLPNIQYCVRAQRNSGDAFANVVYVTTDLETVNSIPFAGKTVTLSFYARAGANYSAASNILSATLVTGTGTDQNSLVGFTSVTNAISASATLTTTWQRFTYTGTLTSTATQIGLQIGYLPTGTAGANDWFELTGVQIDVGSVALPFRTNGGTIQGELQACQRYYQRKVGSVGYQPYSLGFNYSTTQTTAIMPLPVTMRVSPTMGFSAANTFVIQHTSNLTTAATIAGDRFAPDVVQFFTTVASGLTAGQAAAVSVQNAQTGFIEMIAEL
jgi:hypothetical protein